MSDALHTQLPQPKSFRKALLETALDSVETGKFFEALQKMQEEKKQITESLQQSLETMQDHLGAFLKSIPPLPEEFLRKQHRIIAQRFRGRASEITSATEKQYSSKDMHQKGIDADIAELKARLRNL